MATATTARSRVMAETAEKEHGKIILPAKRGFAGKAASDHECQPPSGEEVRTNEYPNGTKWLCTDLVDGKQCGRVWSLQLPRPMAWRRSRAERKPAAQAGTKAS